VRKLRWDHADLHSYNTLTGYYLQGIPKDITDIEKSSKVDPVAINRIYNALVDSLRLSADTVVPACRKNFFKFWCDTELDDLKERSIASCRIWKAAGRPRSGPIFDIIDEINLPIGMKYVYGDAKKNKCIQMSFTRHC